MKKASDLLLEVTGFLTYLTQALYKLYRCICPIFVGAIHELPLRTAAIIVAGESSFHAANS